MSKACFTIAFTGPGTAEGLMDVRELAPSLLAVGTLFDAANATLNGEDANVRVNVRATKQACFEIDLELCQTIVRQLLNIAGGGSVSGALNLIEIILLGGGAFKSLIWIIQKIQGRNIEKLEKLENDTARIFIKGDTIDVPLNLLQLFQDIAVRNAIEKVVDPIGKSAIDGIEFRSNDRQTVIRINENEKKYFATPELPDEIVLEDKRRAAFSILSLTFKEDNKWRLHDGNAQINAIISDDTFLNRVNSNEIAFAKGDILICDVAIIQKRTRDGLKTDYEVIKVVEHKSAARQLPLDFAK